MTVSRKQIALIKVAVKQLGWSDASYRSALAEIAGVTSSTELDREGFDAFMGFLEYCGFKPLEGKGPDCGPRDGMATFAQIELIRCLWAELTRRAYPGEAALNKWLLRTFKVSSLRFLTLDGARKCITAMKAMKAHRAAKAAKDRAVCA
jgi:hypothetical protein